MPMSHTGYVTSMADQMLPSFNLRFDPALCLRLTESARGCTLEILPAAPFVYIQVAFPAVALPQRLKWHCNFD